MKDKLRYRLFYRLIDFCFIVNLLFFLDMIADVFRKKDADYGFFEPVVFAFVAVSILLPCFLIFARFMHDEYIHLLWQKASQTVVRGLIILPLPILLIYGAAMGFSGGEIIELDSGISAKEAGRIGLVTGIVSVWVITPMFFTFAFQWHRWRGA